MAETVGGSDPAIALLPWGDVIEDFLDGIGVSWEAFCREMTGGWLFGYVEALRSAGVRTVLLCFSARASAPARFTHLPTGATIRVLPAGAPFRAARRLSRPLGGALRDVVPYLATPVRALARELRREGCSAVLCQEYEYPRFDACILAGRLLGLPVFATFQGGDWQASRLEHRLRPRTLRAAAGLIVAAATERERLRREYDVPPEKISRIFNPIDLSVWEPMSRSEARRELGFSEEARVVVWHGRVDVRRKGLDLLLDAWARLCLERPGRDLRLLLVGTGSDAEELRQRLADPMLNGVRWIDRYVLDREAMRGFLSAADVYVLPSRHEGFPVAPIEAMACGLPVVAADAPGVRDILEGGEEAGGIVVPRGDPGALQDALGRLLDDPAPGRKLGRRARRRVESHFSLEAVGAQLREVLLPAGRPGGGR